MSVLNSIPAPIVQMGHVEKIVEHQQNLPSVQQQIAQQTAAAEIARERTKIEGNEPSDHGRKIKEKDREEKRQRQRQHQRRQAGERQESENDEEAAFSENREEPGSPGGGNPWAGHIVNVTI